MRELVYALRFRGEAKRIGIDGNVVTTTTSAPGCLSNSRIVADGLCGSLQTVPGGEVTFTSELVFTGETTFQQTGAITFGDAEHRLSVSIVGSGHLGPGPRPDCRQGAAIWRVDGGESQFAGAQGLIVSIIVVSDAGEVTDHHLGVVYLPQP